MNRLKFFTFSLLKLPSTIIHELLHSIPVVLFSITDILMNIIKSMLSIPTKRITKITSFNLIPDYRSGTLGSVGYVNASNIQLIIINIAPILAWISLPFILSYLGYISIDLTTNNIKLLPYSFSIIDVLVFILTIQLIFAGKLSTTDMKNILSGIMSFEFIILMIFLAIFWWLKDVQDIPTELMNILKNFSEYFWRNVS